MDLMDRVNKFIDLLEKENQRNITEKRIECSGQVTLNQKFNTNMDYLLHSKNNPTDYPINHYCLIILNIDETIGGFIELTFKEFNVEYSRNCFYDYLTISDDSGRINFCGIGLNKGNSVDNTEFFKNRLNQPILNKKYKIKPNGALVVHFKSGKNSITSGFTLKLNFRSENNSNVGGIQITTANNNNGVGLTTISSSTSKEETIIRPTNNGLSTAKGSTSVKNGSNVTDAKETNTPTIHLSTKLPKPDNDVILCSGKSNSEINFDCNRKDYDIVSQNPYLPLTNCRVYLKPPKGKNGVIYFKFKSMHLELNSICLYDRVRIIDESKQIYSFCGEQFIGNRGNSSIRNHRYRSKVNLNWTYFIKSNKTIKVNLNTDKDREYSGFRLTTYFVCDNLQYKTTEKTTTAIPTIPTTFPVVRHIDCNWQK
ncbi:DgyrCDS14823 [Dimorphilus gyrociliatus]|uniref:DgyrCDS14823 n=1 Tax=Dimorphilus gyrociliatus TaxID=2664684 RepID=A0A7I8WEZ7_9ANNE|nr:DgyrCDS14823 [Dimorphilus gyrociliatus]